MVLNYFVVWMLCGVVLVKNGNSYDKIIHVKCDDCHNIIKMKNENNDYY